MDFLTNILSGGLLGTVTSLFSGWMKYKQRKDDQAFQLKKIAAESSAAIEEIKANIEVNKVVQEGELQTEYAKADAVENVGRSSLIKALTGNYISNDTLKMMLQDNSLVGKIFRPLIYLHLLFMDAIRGLIRPILTVGIIGYVSYVVYITLGKYLNTGNMVDLMTFVIKPSISLLLFSAATVVGFWFADKAMSRRYQDISTKENLK